MSNRRGHLSSKIPNVKLRPAPAGPSKLRNRIDVNSDEPVRSMMEEEMLRQAMEGEEDEEVSTAALRMTSRPWKGIVITFTGIDNKAHLTELAKELGASVESALTVYVSHVVATGFGSPKYQFAVEHRLPIMLPHWIEESHKRWLAGFELNLEEDIAIHRLPPFWKTRIAISGIEPLERRKQIVQAITDNGGEYRKDLDRTCTHLISAKSTNDSKSSEKVKWAVKELKEREMGRRRGKKISGEDMRIIYEEWLWDCVAYGGRWKEEGYDARKARPLGKVNAENVINGTLVFEEPEVDDVQKRESGLDAENEPAAVRKRKREDIDLLVGEIISATSVKSEPMDIDIKPDIDLDFDNKPDVKPDIKVDISSDIQTTTEVINPTSSTRQPSMLHTSRISSFTAAPSKIPSTTPEVDASIPSSAPVRRKMKREFDNKFFAGKRFSLLIEEVSEGLQKALTAHGGTVFTEEQRRHGQEVDYVVVRLSSLARPITVENVSPPQIVTECYIEACCFESDLLPLDKHLVFQPLPASMPIAGTQSFNIHLSGYASDENVYLRRLIRVIGATVASSMNRQTTHLVTNRADGPKVVKAAEWKLNIISEEWLLQMGRDGMLAPEEPYRLTLPPATSNGQPSQSRLLKMTPTHVDGSNQFEGNTIEVTTRTNLTSTSTSSSSVSTPALPALGSISHPLSPPKPETVRRLNHAQSEVVFTPPPKSSELVESMTSKLGRAVSAPDQESMTKDKELGKSQLHKAATTTESLRSRNMTEALRQLVERGDSVVLGRPKVSRRTRPSGRFKSNISRSPNTSTSSPERPFLSTTATSDRISQRGSSPDYAHSEMEMDDQEDLGNVYNNNHNNNAIVEESMRVEVRDLKGEREKKRLMDALLKGDKGVGRDKEKISISPGKRVKR